MKIITRREVKWLSRYALDSLGEIFQYEGRILRLIKPEKVLYVKKLFEQGIIDAIVEKHLFINTWICDDLIMANEEDTIIIEHEAIKYFTHPSEWTYEMFIDARNTIAKLNICLLQYGYEIIDCHNMNISFQGCQPCYTDLGSITPAAQNGMEGYVTFERYWVNPVKIIRKKRFEDIYLKQISSLAFYTNDAIRLTNNFGVLKQTIYKFFSLIQYRIFDNTIKSSHKIVRETVKIYQIIFHIDEKKRLNLMIKRYSHIVNKKDYHYSSGKDMWSDYSDSYIKDGQPQLNDRFQYYIDLLKFCMKKYDINNIFEIAGNSGVLSQLILEHTEVEKACVSDYNIKAVEKGYNRCKNQEGLSKKISFTVMNIVNTTEWDANRYRSDVVIALAITHHLILSQKVKMSAIVDILAEYTNRYAIVEFMPLGIWASDANCLPTPTWYTLEAFLTEMNEKFKVIQVEQLQKNRVAILAEKSN